MWTNASGTVHFSDRPNPEGTREVIVTAPNTKVTPSPKPVQAQQLQG